MTEKRRYGWIGWLMVAAFLVAGGILVWGWDSDSQYAEPIILGKDAQKQEPQSMPWLYFSFQPEFEGRIVSIKYGNEPTPWKPLPDPAAPADEREDDPSPGFEFPRFEYTYVDFVVESDDGRRYNVSGFPMLDSDEDEIMDLVGKPGTFPYAIWKLRPSRVYD